MDAIGLKMELERKNHVGNKTGEWSKKLVGKKLSEDQTDEVYFAKEDLPENTRILQYGGAHDFGHMASRLNVLVNEEGIVGHVEYGY